MPSSCPLCGASTNIEFQNPASDAPCPSCGCLIWASTQLLGSVKKILGETYGIAPDVLMPSTRMDDMGAESLDIVEFFLEFEEEFDVSIPDDVAGIQTIGDWVRFIEICRRRGEE